MQNSDWKEVICVVEVVSEKIQENTQWKAIGKRGALCRITDGLGTEYYLHAWLSKKEKDWQIKESCPICENQVKGDWECLEEEETSDLINRYK